jgi:CP family cyanate transporter-like MFS transporter
VQRAGVATVVAVILLAINLRTLFASLPPILAEVRTEFGLSAGVAGLLTTGPVACLGLVGPLTPRLARRVSLERLLVGGGLVTAAGLGLRGSGSVAALFAGTMLAGLAVSMTQVALPVLIRGRFPEQVGVLTATFSTALTLGSSFAAGLAVPLDHLLGGWDRSLAFWALPCAVAAVLWLPGVRGTGTRVGGPPSVPVLRSPLAQATIVYFALQSMIFYAGLTWLPTILRAHGWSAETAGTLQGVSNGISFLPAFLLPFLAGRSRTQGGMLVAVVVGDVVGIVGLLLAPAAAVVWMPLLGLASGGALGLGLILPVLRGGDVRTAAALTGMTLSLGYFLASAGPWLLGVARDASGGWTIPLLLLMAMTLLQLPAGWPATRDRTLLEAK